MSEIERLHEDAMNLVELALIQKSLNNFESARDYFIRAYKLDVKAAQLIKDKNDLEPTRSLILRSAASLAVECEMFREAEQLIAFALSGMPPDDLAEELRDMSEEVNFERHLKLRGIDLEPNEFQMSIAGDIISFGLAPIDEFIDRIKTTETLIYRTAERKQKLDFKESGHIHKSVKRGLKLFVSVPRAASFAITFRIGRDDNQPLLPDASFDFSQQVIDELITCFDLINRNQEEILKEKIPQKPYYRNFIALAKKIAPDGHNVKMVGFTSKYKGIIKQIALTKPQNEIPVQLDAEKDNTEHKIVEIVGRLKYADSTSKTNKIKLINDKNKKDKYMVIVPEGMMTDIVKPLWDEKVIIKGEKKGRSILLYDIQPVNED